MKFLVNPFITYAITFISILFLYSLEWSSRYPQLTFELISFFLLTSLFCFIISLKVNTLLKFEYKPIKNKNIGLFTFFNVLLFCLEFIYNKGIPILMIYNKAKYDYTQYGIPTLHVIIVTFCSFLTIFSFHYYLSNRKRIYLLYFSINLFLPLLIMNRGMFAMNIASCLSVFFMYNRSLKIKQLFVILFFGLVLFYAFGVLGNLRINKGKSIDNETFLNFSDAKKEFRNSCIPKEFMWSYYYISSPIANLQFSTTIEVQKYNPSHYFFYELFPNFISKKVENMLGIKPVKPVLAIKSNVGSVFNGAYTDMGWVGMITMFLFIISSTTILLFILSPKSDYFITEVAIINTIILFNAFDNMYAFTGLSFVVVFPILFSMFNKYKVVIKHKLI